jgi:hypothetical protein
MLEHVTRRKVEFSNQMIKNLGRKQHENQLIYNLGLNMSAVYTTIF